MKAMTILYEVHDGLYVNITNKCQCSCTFCLRKDGDGAYESDSLWLEHEPSFEEFLEALKGFDLSKYREVVFCGYGEPTNRIDLIIQISKYLKSISDIKIRLNTNGLGDLINQKAIAPMLEGCIDSVSISLNAPTAEKYVEVARPKYGTEAFKALLKFAEECKKYVPEMMFTVVDTTISPEEIEAARQIAEKMGITFRVRAFV